MEKDSTAGIDFYPGTGEYETVCRPKQPQTAYMGTAVHRLPLAINVQCYRRRLRSIAPIINAN